MQVIHKLLTILVLCTTPIEILHAQEMLLTLDSCRALALKGNKKLLIANEKANAAHWEQKAAFTNYLPKISGTVAYMRNEKQTALLSDEQQHALSNIGTSAQHALGSTLQNLAGALPGYSDLFSALSTMDLATPLNGLGASVADAFVLDTRNVYVGALTLTQPIYTGGKIRAYNNITKFAQKVAEQQKVAKSQEVILAIDQTYWQVVSLVNKKKLADGFITLLNQLHQDVIKIEREGVATQSDVLSVSVKLNEAEMALLKVENGLSLSRMLLSQLCGLPIDSNPILADEQLEELLLESSGYIVNTDYATNNRPEIKSLELAEKIYHEKVKIVRSEHLPQIALMGNYIVSNPSVFNGFENKFKGMWNVGVNLHVPIWNWGEGMYKIRVARAEANIAKYNLLEAKEKIELQVNQSAQKVYESGKRLIMAQNNITKANENLRNATLGFSEGVQTTNNVLEAQTAWLQAQSSKIDAQIDIKITNLYLLKALGDLK